MKVLSAQQMRELDRLTIDINNETSLDLMLRAATAFSQAFNKRWDEDTPVIVFAGPGNNGGDALAVARLLIDMGYDVSTYLFNPQHKLSADCATCKDQLTSIPRVRFLEVHEQFEPPTLNEGMVIIDGLFGTGLNKPLTGGFASLARFINAAPSTVVAIDMPSGLMSENNQGNTPDTIVRADHTFTFQYPKLSLLLDGYAPYYGAVELLDIELASSAANDMNTRFQTIEAKDVASLIKQRPATAHKGTFGTALLVAGRYGMAGAAVLAAKACLRSGVGKVAVHTALKNNDILQIAVPEAIVVHDASATHITTLPSDLSAYNSIGVGPGIGTLSDTAAALEQLFAKAGSPIVVDADALNLLALHRHLIARLPHGSILTPHPGELQRIMGAASSPEALLQKALQLAEASSSYVVLKGHSTAICTPSGEAYFNTTGNAGMATAGAGDVLTGMLTSFLAQGYSPLSASIIGVYLHGRAGDKAEQNFCQHTLTASDIINHFHHAFKECTQGLAQHPFL